MELAKTTPVLVVKDVDMQSLVRDRNDGLATLNGHPTCSSSARRSRLRRKLATLNGHPTWGPCGDRLCGGTGMARSPSTRSVKQEATGHVLHPGGERNDYAFQNGI
jgi:hypothetical protein